VANVDLKVKRVALELHDTQGKVQGEATNDCIAEVAAVAEKAISLVAPLELQLIWEGWPS